MAGVRIDRWEDRGGRTNRATLVRGTHSVHANGHNFRRESTVVFSPEEWDAITDAVLADRGLRRTDAAA